MRLLLFLWLVLCTVLPAAAQPFVAQGLLPLDARQEGHLAVSEAHTWTLNLTAGEYLVVDIEQPDADLTLYVLAPDTTLYTYAETPTGPGATQQARWIADTTGPWHLRLKAVADSLAAGYALTWRIQRPATQQDREIVGLDSLDSRLSAYYAVDDFRHLDSLLVHTLAVAEEALGPEHLDIAGILNRQAVFLMWQNRTDAAQAVLDRALAIQGKAVGEAHPEAAITLSNLAQMASDAGHYEEAESLYQRAIGINQRFLGPTHPSTAKAQVNLASIYYEQGRYAEADTLYGQALTSLEASLGPGSPQVIAVRNNIAVLRTDQGRYDEAEGLYQRVFEAREQIHGPIHSDVAMALYNMAFIQAKRGALQEAEDSYERVHAIWTQTLGEGHPNLGLVLNALATNQFYQDRYALADSLYRRALVLEEQALGPDHPRLATTLSNLAYLMASLGELEEADALYQRALGIKEKAQGPDHPELAILLGNMGQLYQQMGRFEEAEQVLNRALRIQERAWGSDHPDLAINLSNLASLHMERGRYAEADSLYQRVFTIQQATYGPDHGEIGQTLNNQAVLYDAMGRYRDVEALYRRALQIAQDTYGPSHSEVAVVLNNLALKLVEQGRIEEAEPMMKRALEIDARALGPMHYVMGIRYINRGSIHRDRGRYAEAERDYRQALTIFTAAFDAEHVNVALVLNKIAGLYIDQKYYDEAEALLERALAIQKNVYGAQHPDVAGTLNDLAVLYAYQDQFEQAEAYYRQALDILRATSPTSLNYVSGLNNRALTLTKMERYDEAEALLTQATAIFEDHLSATHPALTSTLLAQAETYTNWQRPEAALDAINRALERFEAVPGYEPLAHVRAYIVRARLHHQASRLEDALDDMEEALDLIDTLRPKIGGGEQTRARFLETYATAYDDITDWYLEAGDPERALEHTEQGRARVLLDQLNQIGDLWEGVPEEDRVSLHARDADARARLAEFQQRITLLYGNPDLSERDRLHQAEALKDSLVAAEQAYQQVYRDLKNASPLWKKASQPFNIRQVRTLVPQGGLLMLYQLGKTSSHVFVVSPGRGQVEAFPLEIGEAQAALLGMAAGPLTVDLLHRTLNGTAAPGEQTMPGLLQRFAAPDTLQAETDPIAHTLWQILVPEAVRPRLLAAEEVVLIPDEGLHFLPFEALLVEPGTNDSDHQFWLDVGPVIRYAPSLATLSKFAESASSGAMQTTSILSLSNPTFDPEVVAEQSEPAADPMLLADAEVSARTRYADRGGTFGALPGTARETRAIAMAMGQEESALEVIQGVEATEAALRGALPGKRYLHLATHGLVDARPGGLFASLVLTPPPGETSDLANDGFLQLHEIYDLPLGDAELTVLSACETNIGVAIIGEGVFALSRGFLAAGARRVIASQWNVNDVSTATLIGTFFEAVFEAEQAGLPVDYARALRDAKRRVRQESTWKSPFYWAPFVLIGTS